MARDDETDTSSTLSEWSQIYSADESDAVPSMGSFSQRDTNSTIDDRWDITISPSSVIEGRDSESWSVSSADHEVEADISRSKLSVVDSEITDEFSIEVASEMTMTGTFEATRSMADDITPLAYSLIHPQSELKLSFPDPLGARADKGVASAESEVNAQSTDSNLRVVSSNVQKEDNEDIIRGTFSLCNVSHVTVDSGTTSTPVASPTPARKSTQPKPSIVPSFSIVLYGANPIARWSTAERLLDRAFSIEQSGFDFEETNNVRLYRLNSESNYGLELYVRVVDIPREAGQPLISNMEEPSLALIFLPYTGCLFNHDYFLPLVSPLTSDSEALPDFSEKKVHDSARYSLQRLNIRRNKLLAFGHSSILNEHDLLDGRHRSDIIRLFHRLLCSSFIYANLDLQIFIEEVFLWISKHLNLIMSMAIFLFVVMLPFTINNKEQTDIPADLSMISSCTSISDRIMVSTAFLPTATGESNFESSSESFNDKYIALIQPSMDVLTSTSRNTQYYTSVTLLQTINSNSPTETSSLPTSPVCHCDCNSALSSERFMRSTDLILRPITSLAVVNKLANPFDLRGYGRIGEIYSNERGSIVASTYWSIYEALDMNELLRLAKEWLKPIIDLIDEFIESSKWSISFIKGHWVSLLK